MVRISDEPPVEGLPTSDEIEAFQRGARDLIGVALRSLEVLAGEVSLPQFRMLLALNDLGRCPSSHVAQALGLGASSVTRLADRLHASGHIERGADEHHRSVVALELTERGRRLVDQVLAWRHQEFARILSRLDPGERAATAAGLRAFHAVVGDAYAADLHGPVPL
ncbi:MarR family winged helix-turn-helix transcriptional regulator [Kitasatospora sp. NBC_01266]|uniref:MarR family winged helix-turn-helix transcriptional regulator n=1 Tax=Kitasatospora sp. NBC_01266 TaxID=2903572 RepID=UPI002E33BCBE|nr:MarR family transcriptional regulator [Kitasatospora sp. NBC_01266]